MTMADLDATTGARNTRANSTWAPPHAPTHANHDIHPDSTGEADKCLVSPLEAAIEEERTRLMLADSVLGCLQTALDPEAIKVTPEPYFPEIVELARQFINKSVRHLEYEEIRRHVQSSMSCWR
jgi:hypothetical protein